MDLTIEVMLPPRGAGDYSTSANTKWRVLAPVAVYPLKTVATVGMQNTGYVHVTGVPTPQAWAEWSEERILQRINAILCEAWEDVDRTSLERRIWAGDPANIPAGARNNLRTNRQITVTWTQFKPVFRHLVRDAVLSDADLD